MKPFRMLVLVGAVLLSGTASAASMSLNAFPSRVLPVLVQVDNHGQVREVSPAAELSPATERMVRQTIGRMITQPAHFHGRAVASQLVINLGLQATPRADGRYDGRFVYVSSSPVPPGSWYWVHVDGHRLVLANRSDRSLTHAWPPGHRGQPRMQIPQPVIQRVPSQPASTAVPARRPQHP